MDPQTGASESPPAPVPLEQLGGAAETHGKEAGGLPTPSDLGQLGAAAEAAGPPAPSEQAAAGAEAAGPPEPAALDQLEAGPSTGEPPEPASPEELAARIERASTG